MHDIDDSGYEKRSRAGLIPYLFENGVPKYLMMVSSDPKFGGPRPMISKGKIEEGETPYETAIREAEEELGLDRLNIKNGDVFLLAEEQVRLYSGTYFLSVYGCEILDRSFFHMWCDETSHILWMSLPEFREDGRRDHLKYVEMLEEKILREL